MQSFRDAAALLEGRRLEDREAERQAIQLLHYLGLGVPPHPDVLDESSAAVLNAKALLEAAARMAQLFRLDAPDAPNMVFFGGTVDPAAFGLEADAFETAHVAGRGLDPFQAFASCVGEGVEYLSQLEWPGAQDGPIDVLQGRVLATGETAVVPADLCLRRAHRAPEYRLKGFGSGCAAGRGTTQATLTALLELVERDAAAHWWLGGCRGRPIDGEALSRARDLVDRLRGEQKPRRQTWLLDISSDLGVPAVAAMSVDSAGRDFACGLAARTALDDAVRVAVLELCQMELSNRLVRQKLAERGEAALNALDRRHVRRMTEIVAADCVLLHPEGPSQTPEAPPSDQQEAQLDWLVNRLASCGVAAVAVDLTRPAIGIPAIRVIAPELQRLPATSNTARLERSIRSHGGGSPHTLGIDLL